MLTNNTASSSRRIDLDEVAGLMIIYMILVHIFSWAEIKGTDVQTVLSYIFFYFMPWFFFKAGMFAREKETKEVMGSGYKRLIVPFILYSIIGHIVQMVRMWVEGDTNWIHYVLSPIKQFILSGALSGNVALWFLLTLFMVRMLGNYVCKKHNGRYSLLIILICFLFSFLLCKFNLHKPVYIGNICSGLSFYLIGMLMRDKQYKNSLFIIVCILFTLLSLLCHSVVDMRANELVCGNYIVWCVSSVAGCIVINNIFLRCKWLRYLNLQAIGKDSMNYYVTHWILLNIVTIVVINLCDVSNEYTYFVAMTIACCIILPFCNRIMKIRSTSHFLRRCCNNLFRFLQIRQM